MLIYNVAAPSSRLPLATGTTGAAELLSSDVDHMKYMPVRKEPSSGGSAAVRRPARLLQRLAPATAEPTDDDDDDNTCTGKAGDDEQRQMLFVDAFLQNNRLDHVTQVMGYHPQYLEAFLKTQHFMLRGDGPLPYDYRHYIAIMAAARHNCSYLINTQRSEFLLQGGDPQWLKGFDHIPQKLRDLCEINKVLAHRPWLLNKSHIEKLTRGSNNWSVSELAHAIVLLIHFHSLCSFVFGSGINPEIDHPNGHSFQPPSGGQAAANDKQQPSLVQPSQVQQLTQQQNGTSDENSGEVETGVEALMEKMRRLAEAAEQEEEEPSMEERLQRYEKLEEQTLEFSTQEPPSSPQEDILRFNEDPTFQYQDFAARRKQSAENIPTFRVQDYSWEDQGFSLLNRLYSDMGNLLDEKFKVIYSMTYYTMGGKTDVDTMTFRRAIWNYIQCIFGVRHDDYDYGEVNQLMERNMKSFIKTVSCYPDRISKPEYHSFMRHFKYSEKVHVNLMVVEARMQAEILYALRTIMQYMT